MTQNLRVLAVVAALAAVGCFDLSRQSTRPSSSGPNPQQMAGSWASVASSPSTLQQSCTNFTWNVTELTATSGAGTFSALCFGNMQVNGTAQGTINGPIITWTAQATGTVPGQPPCSITLSGTADLSGDQIQIPYTGNTCFGPIGGTEILRRR